MCLAGRLGAEMDLARVPSPPPLQGEGVGGRGEWLLFSESLCRFVVEVTPEHVAAFEEAMRGQPCAEVGRVWDDGVLRVRGLRGENVVWAEVKALEEAFRGKGKGDWRSEIGDSINSISNLQSLNLQSLKPNAPKKVLILHANGTNRDHDAAAAIKLAGGVPEIVHVNQLLNKTRNLLDYHMLLVPGGFTYGDDLGSGVLWALDLNRRLGSEISQFIASGRPVLGICNGFQALVKAGLLPGFTQPITNHQSTNFRPATLTFNEQDHFECRWVVLEASPNSPSLFTKGMSDLMYCPVAHGEGRFAVRDDAALKHLQDKNLIALRYVGEGYPANPNGSVANIAGICNEAGNVLGLMPHPENHIYPWQHPRWHRGERGQSGLGLFVNGIRNA
jgi:phosphoribosylformylglycinamidine synthase